jgi:hypothetical protein
MTPHCLGTAGFCNHPGGELLNPLWRVLWEVGACSTANNVAHSITITHFVHAQAFDSRLPLLRTNCSNNPTGSYSDNYAFAAHRSS